MGCYTSKIDEKDTEEPQAIGPRTINASHSNPQCLLNGGYWPDWKDVDSLAFDRMNLSILSHVTYAFAAIETDGSISLANQAGLEAWVARKKAHPNLRVLLAIGGGRGLATERFANMVGNEGNLARFVRSVRDFVYTFSLDGVDIDWEYPTTTHETSQFIQLMTRLRQALPAPFLLTTALPAGGWILQHIALAELAKHIDYLNLMAYDFVSPSYPNVVVTGHHAQLYCSRADQSGVSGATAVDYVLSRCFPARKLVLGIPLYGRSFGGANDVYQPFTGPGGRGEYEVHELPRPGMTEIYNASSVAVFATGNDEFITYDNQHSVREKAKFARSKALAGLFYWHLAADRRNEESLVDAGFKALNQRPSEQ